jgi:C-5 cytosine-specific DNA methylase
VYPSNADLSENDEPRDFRGQVQPLPKVNMIVAGTSCKNFGMTQEMNRYGVRSKADSGETFFAVAQVILQEQPQVCVLENVTGAPWQNMADYICGRIKLWEDDSKKGANNCGSKDGAKQELKKDINDLVFSFCIDTSKIVVEEVPFFLGVQCGDSVIAGYLKGNTRKDPSRRMAQQYCQDFPVVGSSQRPWATTTLGAY